jgi:CRP/FNR family cyclic AMP-dependent transcriptional regulator
MTDNEDQKPEEPSMVTTLHGTPLPTGVDRRSRRWSRMHSAYQAIKAQHAGEQTPMQGFADWLTGIASSTGFFFFHVVGFAVWLTWNSNVSPLPKFDPFPYGFLTMVVSLEAIFLSIFVLMSQGRESKIGELREELTLQVNL